MIHVSKVVDTTTSQLRYLYLLRLRVGVLHRPLESMDVFIEIMSQTRRHCLFVYVPLLVRVLCFSSRSTSSTSPLHPVPLPLVPSRDRRLETPVLKRVLYPSPESCIVRVGLGSTSPPLPTTSRSSRLRTRSSETGRFRSDVQGTRVVT